MTGKEREDWALADRDVRALVSMMLAFQLAVLAIAMLWM